MARTVRITDVHPGDAFYDIKDELIGTTGIIEEPGMECRFIEIGMRKDWYAADMYFNPPIQLSDGPLSSIFFFGVKFEEVKEN